MRRLEIDGAVRPACSNCCAVVGSRTLTVLELKTELELDLYVA